jgi:hypothetical protein
LNRFSAGLSPDQILGLPGERSPESRSTRGVRLHLRDELGVRRLRLDQRDPVGESPAHDSGPIGLNCGGTSSSSAATMASAQRVSPK